MSGQGAGSEDPRAVLVAGYGRSGLRTRKEDPSRVLGMTAGRPPLGMTAPASVIRTVELARQVPLRPVLPFVRFRSSRCRSCQRTDRRTALPSTIARSIEGDAR